MTRATTWSASRHFCLVERHLIVEQHCSQVYGQENPDKLENNTLTLYANFIFGQVLYMDMIWYLVSQTGRLQRPRDSHVHAE